MTVDIRCRISNQGTNLELLCFYPRMASICRLGISLDCYIWQVENAANTLSFSYATAAGYEAAYSFKAKCILSSSYTSSDTIGCDNEATI